MPCHAGFMSSTVSSDDKHSLKGGSKPACVFLLVCAQMPTGPGEPRPQAVCTVAFRFNGGGFSRGTHGFQKGLRVTCRDSTYGSSISGHANPPKPGLSSGSNFIHSVKLACNLKMGPL